SLRVVLVFSFPLAIVLFISAPGLVRLVYGQEWSGVVPLVRALALACFAMPILDSFQWVFVSNGFTNIFLKWSGACAAITISSFGIGLFWGSVGVAWACSISTLILTFGPGW